MKLSAWIMAGALSLAFASEALCANYSYSVTNGSQSVAIGNAGEVQSTVVGPGLNAQCPAGRILLSMDTVRPPQTGTMLARDLSASGPPDIQSTFGADPDSQDAFLTNDDDIVTLSNGDLLLVWGYHSIAPLNPKPGWFDITYKGTFGPGVRRGSIVYRSTDCGKSFHYAWRFDPAKLSGDGLCAYPKPPLDANGHYGNGGSDGQLTKVASTGDIYFTMDCVGSRQDTSKPGFVLGNTPVNRTYVLMSKASEGGTTWHNLGFIGADGWRTGVVARSNGNLVFSALGANFLSFANKQSNGSYTFPSTVQPTGIAAGWSDFCTNAIFAKLNPGGNCGSAVPAHTLVTRVPGSDKIAMAYPATIKDSSNKSVDGYVFFEFDPATNQFAQGPSLFPAVHAASHFIMHMVAVDPGSGPILFYWDDVDGTAASGPQSATIRGRFLYEDGNYSSDFVIAKETDGSTHKISMTAPHWYGDYHTAGGYPPHGIVSVLSQQYVYYPMWIEANSTAHYTKVTVTRTVTPQLVQGKPNIPILYPKWKPGPPPVEISKVASVLHTAHTTDDEIGPMREMPARK